MTWGSAPKGATAYVTDGRHEATGRRGTGNLVPIRQTTVDFSYASPGSRSGSGALGIQVGWWKGLRAAVNYFPGKEFSAIVISGTTPGLVLAWPERNVQILAFAHLETKLTLVSVGRRRTQTLIRQDFNNTRCRWIVTAVRNFARVNNLPGVWFTSKAFLSWMSTLSKSKCSF